MYLTLRALVKYCLFCRMKKIPPDPLRAWVLQNRGFQAAIAQHLGLTRAHVCGVLKKRFYSDRGRIEGILAGLGAPGMRERELEARKRAREITWTDREKNRLLAQLRKIQANRAGRAA